MATQLFLRDSSPSVISLGGTNYERPQHADASDSYQPRGGRVLSTIQGSSLTTVSASSQTGPVASPGIEFVATGEKYRWISSPLAADVTISGTITFNLWGHEGAMSANGGFEVIVERHQPDGTVTTIIDSEEGVELGTSASAHNWTATPTSTACKKGDWLVVRVSANDAGGTMASGSTFTLSYNAATGVQGDSYVTFNESLTFQSTDPAGSTLKLLDDASDLGGSGQKKLWTDAAGGSVDCVTNTVASTTADAQVTASAGGTALSWFTPTLAAVTLDGLIKLDLYGLESSASANASWRAQLYKTNGSGTSPVLIADSNGQSELATSAGFLRLALVTQSFAVAAGERLKLVISQTSARLETSASASGFTTTLKIEDATNTSQITFAQTLAEGSAGTNANAEHASATGASNQPTIALTSPAGHSSATATANTALAGVGPLAGQVSATGQAFDATVQKIDGAGHASATASANQPITAITVAAEHAAATGAAQNATAGVGGLAGLAAATAVANQSTIAIGVSAGHASATASAFDATVSTGANQTNAPAGHASATATANASTAALGVNAEHAAATGTANTATSALGVPARHAAATGAAQAPTIAISPNPGHASAIVSAFDATIAIGISAGHASATATAQTAVAALGAIAGFASATGAANNPVAAIAVLVSLAAASATAYDVTSSGGAPDPNPVTLTFRDRGHTATVADKGLHTASIRDRGHSHTGRELER